ncbi:M1 family metallopeptidase [Massilia sp. TS11]|uniref:M1 family metallopeptidase n=1 Tax=Massilia sp. TS11 TaxID=2908003 RepID=UPI001EDA435A|nr:M1 family metallopeptidase [Massilia sp. TS11]MCG2584820.1 M1 family metallopeptidase [Massilia sp. TS11]
MRIDALILLAAVLALPARAADPLSYAHPEQVQTTELDLRLRADFGQRVLSGTAELGLRWRDPGARQLDLDTRALRIAKVEALGRDGRWRRVPFRLGPSAGEKGAPLQIRLREQAPRVRIHYRTSPQAAALQWLQPVQTLSGKQPFLFSQNEPINARSWLPVQDTPSVRFPYRAHISAPRGLRVVMSAENDPQARTDGEWDFRMPQPVPAYLVALAIGELEVRELGPRTAVYAEPQRIAAAAYELADTEKMVAAAEALYGPYRWGRYDMLVLPPSFPIGGMENPRLTFVTPTMIAGDRSLNDLIAHELAHSWSGNLVTNASWKHWWLNEGVTEYVTVRVVEALYGEAFATMTLQLEQEEALASLAALAPAKQALVTHDPDTDPATYTDEELAYPKGAWFLRTIEQRVGRARFDAFLREWFDSRAFQSARTEDFLSFLRARLPQALSEAEIEAWVYGPGIPATAQRAHSARLDALDAQRQAWLGGAALQADGWSALEWMKFLNDVDGQASADALRALDARYHLAESGNKEIAFRFLRAAVKAGVREVRAPLRAFLLTVGRQKFVLPLYSALQRDADDRAWARAVYAEARPHYHPVTQTSADKIMKGQ